MISLYCILQDIGPGEVFEVHLLLKVTRGHLQKKHYFMDLGARSITKWFVVFCVENLAVEENTCHAIIPTL